MKGREFKGSYTAKDFADYCFAFDDGDEGSLPWEESMHVAYGALREHVESSFADTPWPAFILGCEAQFGISEEFFEELFSPRLRCYSSEAFFGDGSCLLLERGVKEKLIELVSKTTAFDKAIADGKALFLAWLANGMCQFDDEDAPGARELFRAYFEKERKLASRRTRP